jgi:hypothetical protein
MYESIQQGLTKRVVVATFLASDHVTAATGKTIPVVISKNGGAFANPSAGATNLTEIAHGFYYFDRPCRTIAHRTGLMWVWLYIKPLRDSQRNDC